jgi:hypothetical protein
VLGINAELERALMIYSAPVPLLEPQCLLSTDTVEKVSLARVISL